MTIFEITNDEPLITDILTAHRNDFGADYEPYANHVWRVFNLSLAYSGATGNDRRKLAVAAAFHDLGIWTDHTFDYLQPSIVQAARHLANQGRTDWIYEVSLVISEHHKVSKFAGIDHRLVNAFRAADWMDVMLFKLPSRIPKPYLQDLLHAFPRCGFHRRLFSLWAMWARQHPFTPFPMLKW